MTAARTLHLEPQTFPLRWVHAPRQARTREGLLRLLEAAEELIAEKGFEEAGIAEIAQRAETSVGGFYRRFRDKDGVIQALHQRFCEDAMATADEALDPRRWLAAPLATVVREFVAFLVQIHRQRAGLLRAFVRHAQRDESVRARTADLFRYLSEKLRALLETKGSEITHPEPELAAAFGLEMILGTLDSIIQLRPHALALSDERLIAEVSRAFGAYLGIQPRGRHRRPADPSRRTRP